MGVWAPENRTFFPFQIETLENLIKRKHTLLAHEQGLGKSCIAIGLINYFNLHQVLIICKASIKSNWQNKLNEWLKSRREIQILWKKTDEISPLAEIVIVNYDLISHSYTHLQLVSINWQLVICDECHIIKNMKAKRTHAVLSKKGIIHHTERSLMMTGTPILNRPSELYPILKVLSPETIEPYTNYFSYAKRFCDAWQDGFTFNDRGASHTDDLNQRLRKGFMIRRTWAEVEKELPARRYEMVLIDKTPGAEKSLKILENVERTDFKKKAFGIGGGELATLRREVAEEKITVCLEKIKEYVESADKTVIFAYHHSVIDRLERELKEYGILTLTGNTPAKKRQEQIDIFRCDGGRKVFIGQIEAAGEGIDGIQQVCHNILFVEWDWSPGKIAQAIARVWRLGQQHPVLIRFLVWENSIETHMLRTVLDKVKIIKEVLTADE